MRGDSPDSVLEEVVEDSGQIVMQGVEEQQVVMVTEGELGGQQIVITDGNIVSGSQVIQIHGGESIVVDTRALKTEPEDLSVSMRQGRQIVRISGDRTINLEEGAQAIQASAAACVQTVIRSLNNMKDEDKGNLSSLLPAQTLGQERLGNLLIEDDLTGDDCTGGSPPAKRARPAPHEPPKLNIAKQYSPFGFHVTLEAATAQWVRKDEDRCTYMNKGQFYGITLEYRVSPTDPIADDLTNVKSVIMLVFRDAKVPEDELNAWEFWHQRQPTSKQRILEAETNKISEQCGVTHVEDVSYNAIAVYWNPLEKPAFLSLAIQCLSTDFSLQKGVKGLPMHLQVDTYAKGGGGGGVDSGVEAEYEMIHRAYCQVKVFCDKGAERKFRQEERRAARKVAVGGQRVLDMYHQCQERSEFYTMVDLSRIPVLYSPVPGSPSSPGDGNGLLAAGAPPSGGPPGPGFSLLKHNNLLTGLGSNSNGGGGGLAGSDTGGGGSRRRKSFPPPDTRMVVYVRQENEEIYTPLHLVPPSVPGLARAIESKYNVSATAIRYLYRRNIKGITAKLDDDLLKFYCNEDTFLMQVTAIELEGVAGQESIMYDITLCEIQD